MNNTEIEKKYLVSSIPFDLSLYDSKIISQAYISVDPVIRIRQLGSEYFLTVKGSGKLSRTEYELEITKKQFDNLTLKSETRFISKIRYYIPQNNGIIFELDVYKHDLDGLLTIEVEFESIDAANAFTAPSWFGRDVTGDPSYTNANLAIAGNSCK